MSRSTDPGHFFQTSDSLAQSDRKAAKAKNKLGDPIRLRSKALACARDPLDDGALFIATAGGLVEHVNVETGEVDAACGGPTAPLACLDVNHTHLFAGCWDKAVYGWKVLREAATAQQRPSTTLLRGHTDFVKTLVTAQLGSTALLLTGGSDGTIVVWDASSGEKLHTLKGHARGVQALAIDPTTSTTNVLDLVSADSTNEIRRWRVTADSAAEISMASLDSDAGAPFKPLIAHETSVYALHFDADGDLWTASADKTAKCLVRERQWKADTVLEHPDFVRDVLVDEEGGWVITACRDEEVRVWERSSGELFHTFSGHYEEVTGLLLLGRKLVSVSIDATVRQWSLASKDLQKAKEEAAAEAQGVKNEVEETKPTSMLTEEEERELAELMDDDDD